MVCRFARGQELLGYLVVDSTVAGRACGGLRMLPDLDEAEIRGLARAMTLKYGFLGLPQGGAKAGVIGDPEAPLAERRRRLADFARAAAPLLRSRIYVPATDMGVDNDDVRYLLGRVGMRPRHRELRGARSAEYTAHSVFAGIQQAVRRRGVALVGASVAIEGYGRVGRALAALLANAGARIVAVSNSNAAIHQPHGLDLELLERLAAELGSHALERYPDARRIELPALLELPVDVLAPCARHDSIRQDNVGHIAARVVCAGANNPVTSAAELALFERGIVYPPDFVTNCGGVLGGTMEFAAMPPERIAAFIQRQIGTRIGRLLDESARRQITPRAVVEPLALQRFTELQRRAAHPTPAARLMETALELYRRGLIPTPLVAALAPVYFERALE